MQCYSFIDLPPKGTRWYCQLDVNHQGEHRTSEGRLWIETKTEVIAPTVDVTLADVDKAMAAIPEPTCFADYGKTYRILPGGGFEEIV